MAIKVDPSADIPTKSSNESQWIEWHKALNSSFGKKQANALFVKAWRYRGTSSANTLELRNYLKKQGITIDASVFDDIVDIGGGIADTFTGIFNFGKYTTYAVVGIVVIGAGMIVFNLAKSPAQNAGTILKAFK